MMKGPSKNVLKLKQFANSVLIMTKNVWLFGEKKWLSH